MTSHEHRPGSELPPPGTEEKHYGGHRFAYRDDEDGFRLWIDGRSWAHMAGRVGPEQYYTHLLPFVEFSTPEAMAQAVIDVEGEAWIDEEGDDGPNHTGPQGNSH